MSLLQHSYVTELELLIINVLLPAYEKQCIAEKKPSAIKPELLDKLMRSKKIPALFRPFEKCS